MGFNVVCFAPLADQLLQSAGLFVRQRRLRQQVVLLVRQRQRAGRFVRRVQDDVNACRRDHRLRYVPRLFERQRRA